MRIFLAPMEGVVDTTMRELLTEMGGIDYCATEFIRVTDRALPPKVFYRFCPELRNGGKTRSGVPVYCQLLGGSPEWVSENALIAIGLGAPGIDLNFGCPAKTVNRHDGGAAILKNPRRIYDIALAVRKKVGAKAKLSVKIRLGFHHPNDALTIAKYVEQSGADWLSVHARTRDEGYRPPAHWDWIYRIQKSIQIPVIANGDIWTFEDYVRCREISGCEDVMLGRGLIARPDLALQIKLNASRSLLSWNDIKPKIGKLFEDTLERSNEKAALSRLKQWTHLLSRTYPESEKLFEQIKRLDTHQISQVHAQLQG